MKSLKILYDEEGDVLYVKFTEEPSGSTASLNDMVVLRFDPQTHKGLGLTFLSFSRMLPADDGSIPPAFALTHLADLPEHLRSIVWNAINCPPVTSLLHIAPGQTPAESRLSLILQPVLADLLGPTGPFVPQSALLSLSQTQFAHP
jgi:uncharacterized protein YuzE